MATHRNLHHYEKWKKLSQLCCWCYTGWRQASMRIHQIPAWTTNLHLKRYKFLWFWWKCLLIQSCNFTLVWLNLPDIHKIIAANRQHTNLARESLFVQQFMLWCHNFQHYLVVFWVQKTKYPYPNQTPILTLTVILIPTLTLFQFKVKQFKVIFWRHNMNCCTYIHV